MPGSHCAPAEGSTEKGFVAGVQRERADFEECHKTFSHTLTMFKAREIITRVPARD